jgi:drug/metabolite transporter (DMT)-like permease
MTAEERRSYLELHVAVLLFGFTAILGDLIQLAALLIVWWRVFITSVSLVPIVRPRQLFRQLEPRVRWRFAGIGVLVALHWLTFFGAAKLANASVCLVTMATTSFFTAILEPFIVKRPFYWVELALGLIIVPGMALIVNSLDLSMIPGVISGLVSAFLISIFAALNKKYIGHTDPIRITFLELSSAWAFLSVVIAGMLLLRQDFGAFFPPAPLDWLYLLILALLCTSLAYVLAMRALRHLSAFASSLTINLEPVYGIALAWVLLNENEELGPNFYWGVLIILIAVFSYPLLRRYLRRRGLLHG